MAYLRSALANLSSLRKRGQVPELPVIITDDWQSAAWALKNKFYMVPREEITDNFAPFAGLNVMFITYRPFEEVRPFALALKEYARGVVMVDAAHDRRCLPVEAA